MGKNNIFSNLEPKTAGILGAVTGLLVLGTLGFVIMLVIFLGGGDKDTAKTLDVADTNSVVSAPSGIVKAQKPNVELFIMSHCPYGLQMQKAYIPVARLLEDKADVSIKFVYYVMHGLKEIEEQNRQVCIQNEQNDKYLSYAECFSATDDSQGCIGQVGVNKTKLASCVSSLDSEYGIMAEYNNKANWLSDTYPIYPVYNDLNQKYGVGGSPTVVINGSKVEGVSRSPEGVKAAVCAGFINPPVECEEILSSAPASPGFGGGTGADGDASCG